MEPTVAILPLFDEEPSQPVADRLRAKLEDIVGQDHLLAPAADSASGPVGRPAAPQHHRPGPPGAGKSIIARLLTGGRDMAFEPVPATFPAQPNHPRPPMVSGSTCLKGGVGVTFR